MDVNWAVAACSSTQVPSSWLRFHSCFNEQKLHYSHEKEEAPAVPTDYDRPWGGCAQETAVSSCESKGTSSASVTLPSSGRARVGPGMSSAFLQRLPRTIAPAAGCNCCVSVEFLTQQCCTLHQQQHKCYLFSVQESPAVPLSTSSPQRALQAGQGSGLFEKERGHKGCGRDRKGPQVSGGPVPPSDRYCSEFGLYAQMDRDTGLGSSYCS
ncbi:hypothetical protein Anapl_08809 [Anas platyrhynchos]|uniref:Uncharacterized protein n=1 Tax=Anas platyrhynchos TaxID=8839 RepID=R0LDT1_ANAPL|nr:hypothetical protein Anapl_08809 [Anas platyrhynchos]